MWGRSNKYPGGFKVNAENRQRFEELWQHPVPDQPGLATGDMLEAAHQGELDFLYNLGGNLHHTIDPLFMVEAFEQVKLRVHQDININTSTLIEPGELLVLLPAQTRYEQRGGGTSTSTERRIRFSPEIPGHPVVGECKPEWEIPGLIAAAAHPELEQKLVFPTSQSIRDEMAVVMPVYHQINTLKKKAIIGNGAGRSCAVMGIFPIFRTARLDFMCLSFLTITFQRAG